MNKAIRAVLIGMWGIWSAVAMAAVDANAANAADLDSVKGIGPGTSSRILEARKAGPFKDWADFIERVRGIGPGNATKLSDNGLTIHGQTFKGVPAPAKKVTDKAPDKAPAVAAKAANATAEPAKRP